MSTTFSDVIANTEDTIEAAENRRAHYKAESKTILDRAVQANRTHLTTQEQAKVDALLAKMDALDSKIRAARRTLDRVRTEADDDDRITRLSGEVHHNADASGRTASFSAGRNERTYNPDKDFAAGGKPGAAFLLDAGRAFFGDPEANARLAAHQNEERIERGLSERSSAGVGTGAFTGLVVPQYVTELYAPAVAAMRPFADICNHHDLPPDGMSVNLSRITTPSSVALQASELAAVSFTDMDDTLLTVNVQTAAGQQLASRQAIERGTLVEQVITQDLLRRYATVLDNTLLNQATNGLSFAGTAQTYTNATLDTTAVPAFLKQMITAANTVETSLLGQASPSHYVMHPRRFRWLTAAVSTSWPVMSGVSSPPVASGMTLTRDYPGVKALMADGTKVVVDANVTTTGLAGALTGGTQDFAYALAADESHLWEDANAPVLLRCEQPSAANLGILFVAYGYFAFSHLRYNGSAVVVSGTGTATPSFA